MLWRACNLFAALVVVCVCLGKREEEGSERVGFMSERAKTYAYGRSE
jgi:hypothetical protein